MQSSSTLDEPKHTYSLLKDESVIDDAKKPVESKSLCQVEHLEISSGLGLFDLRTGQTKFDYSLANDQKLIQTFEKALQDPHMPKFGNAALVVGNSYFLSFILRLPDHISTLYICDIDSRVFSVINKILSLLANSKTHQEFIEKINADARIMKIIKNT